MGRLSGALAHPFLYSQRDTVSYYDSPDVSTTYPASFLTLIVLLMIGYKVMVGYTARVTTQPIYCTNTVQTEHLQLNCTYSNYTEAAATCSAALQYSTITVKKSATELYLE